MKRYILVLVIILRSNFGIAQDSSKDNGFTDYYPIATKPTFSYQSNMNAKESILFDAKPIVYYSIYNNMRKNMQESNDVRSNAIYITFQPHIRMYAENSKPIKTPSYRILLGWQQLYKTKNNNFFAWAIETGHYSKTFMQQLLILVTYPIY